MLLTNMILIEVFLGGFSCFVEQWLSFVWTGDWWQQSNHGLLSYRPWLQDWWPQHISQQYASCRPCDCTSKDPFCVRTLNLGFSGVVSFGSCFECRTIRTPQEPRSSTSFVILALSLSLVVVLWYIFLSYIALIYSNSQWKLSGTNMYINRFHKMFQSTWW